MYGHKVSGMSSSYKDNVFMIQKMLFDFVKSKVIDIKRLSEMDMLIEKAEQAQITVLNHSNLPLSTQTIVFGANRNITTSLKVMKDRLRTAAARHENPTTAEQALQLIESLSNVASYLDSSPNMSNGNLEDIEKFSRILYKKAMSLGFSQDFQTQFAEAGISDEQIKSFIDNFGCNLAQELDIEEEVQTPEDDN